MNTTTIPASASFSERDHQFMARAIELAQKGQYTTTPNPNVGCVVVKDNKILAEGWHKKAGTGHAEVNALAALNTEASTGATAYVTLEPCSHYGRTPPCALKLIEAKVARVVIAMLDTNPLVSGNGVKLLLEAGIEVEVGLLAEQARHINLGFFKRMEHKLPYVQLKLACSLDGKTALHNGESKWITGVESRADVQAFRARSCAILSTAQTVLQDNARLNVRSAELPFVYPLDETNEHIRQPIKVVLDGQNRIQSKDVPKLALFESGECPTQVKVILVKSTQDMTQAVLEFESFDHIQVIAADYSTNDGFNLKQVLELLAEQQINNIWVEAGAKLAAALISQRLVDELIVYIAPKLMGKGAQELLPIGPFDSMDETKSLNLLNFKSFGDDLRLTYSV